MTGSKLPNKLPWDHWGFKHGLQFISKDQFLWGKNHALDDSIVSYCGPCLPQVPLLILQEFPNWDLATLPPNPPLVSRRDLANRTIARKPLSEGGHHWWYLWNKRGTQISGRDRVNLWGHCPLLSLDSYRLAGNSI